MYFLQLFRWKNLLIIAFVQVLIAYYLIPLFKIESDLSRIEFILIVTASLLIAAAGNIINDFYDIEIDKINRPDKVIISRFISKKKALRIYFFMSLIATITGLWVSYLQAVVFYVILFIIPQILLFLYARYLKKMMLIGNLVISLLIAFSIFIVALFEKILLIDFINPKLQISHIIWGLMFFSFLITFIREVIKDQQDIIGDKAFKVNSIPIKYGVRTTHRIIKLIVYSMIIILLLIALFIYREQIFLTGYILLGIFPSLFLFLEQLNKVKDSNDYLKISTLLKIIMLVGIFSVFMISV